MVATVETPPERDLRGPGCDERCRVLRALLPGVFGRSELLLHDAEAHEAWGRKLALGGADPSLVVVSGPLTIDLATYEVRVDGASADLTPTEFRILRLLAERIGMTVERGVVLSQVWGGDDGRRLRTPADSHLLRVNMARIRRRLGTAAGLVRTVTGIGYRLDLLAAGATAPPKPGRNWGFRPAVGWSIRWERCRRCGQTDHAHFGHGYCSRCYHRVRRNQAG